MLQFPKKFDSRIAVSLREASELLGVQQKTIYNCLQSGTFPLVPFRVGRFVYFSLDEIRRLISGASKKPGKRD